jgi:Uma2 family endonuclease
MATQAASQAQLSLDEYLRTGYRPDREYLDGELRERNGGKWEHARIQWLVASWFANHEAAWGIMGSTEQRTLVAESRVRIPDLVLVKAEPQPDVLVEAPLLVVEILSPDDSYSDTEARAADYQRMGVGVIWIIDPQTRTGRMCIGDAWTAAGRLEVPGTAVYLVLDEVFKYMDRSLPGQPLVSRSLSKFVPSFLRRWWQRLKENAGPPLRAQDGTFFGANSGPRDPGDAGDAEHFHSGSRVPGLFGCGFPLR